MKIDYFMRYNYNIEQFLLKKCHKKVSFIKLRLNPISKTKFSID